MKRSHESRSLSRPPAVDLSHRVRHLAHLDMTTITSKKSFSNGNFYALMSTKTHSTENNLTIQAIEEYARYASKSAKLSYPIFSKKAYDRANIQYCAFFIGDGESGRNGISLIALYDNYESTQKTGMKLRFVWRSTLDDTYKIDENINELNQLVKDSLTQASFTLLENSQRMTGQSYVCPFNLSPIQTAYAPVLNPYPDDACILRKLDPSPLNPQDWQTQQRLVDTQGNSILGNEYDCFKLTGPFRANILEIAHENATFLKREAHYDFTYKINNDTAKHHDIYYILNREHTACLGVFIFNTQAEQQLPDVINKFKNSCLSVQRNRTLDSNHFSAFLQEKISKNKAKQETAERNGGSAYEYLRSDYSRIILGQPIPTVDQRKRNENTYKYVTKRANYQDMLFYWKSKTQLDVKLQDKNALSSKLQVAWIHPFYRRQSILQKLWPVFQRNYGAFLIDQPTDKMKNFLDKQQVNKAGSIAHLVS